MLSILLTILQKTGEFSTSSKGREYVPPDGPLYYIILIGSSAIVFLVVILAAKWFLWPGEKSEDHIKRRILNPGTNESKNHE